MQSFVKSNYSKIKGHKHYAKAVHWTKLLSVTGGTQIIVQGTGLITGLMLVRFLPIEEYAFYTIANTMLGTMVVFADGGISTGVMAEGAKVWKDKKELGKVLATGIDLRRKFAIYSLLVTVPILIYLLNKQGANVMQIVLTVAALIPSFYAALSDSLLSIISKLHQDIKALQANQLVVSIIRLVMSVGSVFLFPFTFVALLANGIPRLYGNIKLKKLTLKHIEPDQQSSPEVKKNILGFVKKTLPGSIYYCFSSQIQIWLISIFGSTESLASVGAIGRLAMVLSLFNMIMETLIIPRFARLPNSLGLIRKMYLIILGILFAMTFFVGGLVWLFPDQILSVLGDKYQGLQSEVLLIMVGSCLGLVSGLLYRLNAAKGIIPSPYIFIPSIIVSQAIVLSILDLSVLANVLWFSIIISLVGIVIRVFHFFYEIGRVTRAK